MKRTFHPQLNAISIAFLVLCGTGILIASNVLPAGSVVSGEVAPNVVQAQNKFGANLFKTLARGKVGNVVISPTSLFLALSMAANGASDYTLEEMNNALCIAAVNDKLLNSSNSNLIKSLKESDGQSTLEVANAIYLKEGLEFKDAFVKTNKEAYDAEIARAKFGEASAVEQINSWVRAKTHEKIPQIVSELDDQTAAVLLNAIYFKGQWIDKFDKNLTRDQTFTQADDTQATCKMMQKTAKMNWMCGEDFQAVGLPYKGGRFSLYVFLPDPEVKTWSLISKMGSAGWQAQYKKFAKKQGTLVFPKVKIECDREVKNGLRTLGMQLPFDRKAADFRRMTKEPVFIERVIHKTLLDINEEGTEAAAATAVVTYGKGLFMEQQSTFSMICDRPYIVVLRDNQFGCDLFVGVINRVDGQAH